MTNTPTKTIPRDGRLLALILASKGIGDADERVIHQLLDFAHRYTAEVLQSAQALADHAARPPANASRIEKEDVELAIQMRRRNEFVEAPPRDYLANLAHELNSQPLPPLPESFELVRLPPPHQRLTEVTFDLVPTTAAAVLAEAEADAASSDSDESDSDSDADEDDADGEEDADGDADMRDDDEEMEEVGVPVPAVTLAAPPAAPVQEREVDEDYDA